MESFFTEHQAFLETLAIILAITGPVTGAVVAWLKKKFNCLEKMKSDIETEDQRSLRQSKGLIILAYRIDDINMDQHDKKLNLGPEMETILKDEHGKL